jgi:hypothetical protein
MPEIAGVLKVSLATAERHWNYARTWLYAELKNRHGSTNRVFGQRGRDTGRQSESRPKARRMSSWSPAFRRSRIRQRRRLQLGPPSVASRNRSLNHAHEPGKFRRSLKKSLEEMRGFARVFRVDDSEATSLS